VSVETEKKTELGLIVRNAGMDVFGQAFNIVFSFVASVIITRTIGPELFGKYSLANSIFQVLCILAVFGLNRGIVRLTSKYMALQDTGRVKGTVVSAMTLTSVFSLVLVGLAAVAAPALTRKFYSHVTGLDLVLRVYVIGLPFFALMMVINGYTQGLKTLKPSVIVEMIVRPVARLIFILLLFLAGLRLFAVVIGGVGAFVASAIIAFLFAVRVSPFDFRKTRGVGVTNELFFYSLPLVLANFMNVLISRSNVMISGYYLDPETVGILSGTLVLAPFVSISLMSFSKIFAPIISEFWEKGDRLGLMHHFKTVSKWIFTLSLPVFCLYLLFAPGILNIFGEDFTRGATALMIMALGQIVNAVVGPIGFILTMTGRQKLNLVNSICLAGSNVVLNIVLIPKYGMNGAALGTMLSLAATNILRVLEVKILYGFTPFRYDLIKPVAAGAVATAVFYFLNRYLQWTAIPHTIGLCIAFAVLYIVVLYALGLREEREVLKEILKRKKR
jgi:O-antigen/teichoic acid export membrane protein